MRTRYYNGKHFLSCSGILLLSNVFPARSRGGHGHGGAVAGTARAGSANSTSDSSPKCVGTCACLRAYGQRGKVQRAPETVKRYGDELLPVC